VIKARRGVNGERRLQRLSGTGAGVLETTQLGKKPAVHGSDYLAPGIDCGADTAADQVEAFEDGSEALVELAPYLGDNIRPSCVTSGLASAMSDLDRSSAISTGVTV
jgi:hypothetical protein